MKDYVNENVIIDIVLNDKYIQVLDIGELAKNIYENKDLDINIKWTIFNKLIQKGFENYKLYIYAGLITRKCSFKDSLALFEKAHTYPEKDNWCSVYYAEDLFNFGKKDDSIDLLKKVCKESKFLPAFKTLIIFYCKINRYDDAESTLDVALKIYPNDTDLSVYRNAFLINKNSFDQVANLNYENISDEFFIISLISQLNLGIYSNHNREKWFKDFINIYKEKLLRLNYSRLIKIEKIKFSYIDTKPKLIDDDNLEKIFDDILISIKTQNPYLFIRVADGEGGLISYLDHLFEKKENSAINIFIAETLGFNIWNTWFNRNIFNEYKNDLYNIYQLFISAIESATVISRPSSLLYSQDNNFLSRNGDEYISKWIDNNRNSYVCEISTINNLQINFNFISKLLSSVNEVGIVSCHENIVDFIQHEFKIPVSFIKIPHQRSWDGLFGYGAAEVHFPTIFNRLINEIEPKSKGMLYLVGGGFLGKLYSYKLFEKGAIALDIGAYMDFMAGFNTRGLISDILKKNPIKKI
jgi:tetratricopeptide (TPR) repeat protein